MRIDDRWCAEALDIIRDIDANLLITSLDRRYGYDELKEFDLIASCTTGTDHIDHRDIPLISLKGERAFLDTIYATSEHTLALILALVRRLPAAHNDVLAGHWERERWQGRELGGKTLGIVGYGRLGRHVEKFAYAFDIYTHRYDPNQRGMDGPDHWKRAIRSDIITVHVPLTAETRNMFNAETFAQMKRGAYFINTSRGAVVDESALLDALESGHLAGAALDVVCGEPDNINPRLLEYARTHDNLILTPHIGGNTREAREKTQIYIANKIRDYVGGVRNGVCAATV